MRLSRRQLFIGAASSALAFGIPIDPIKAGLHMHGSGIPLNPKVQINPSLTPDLSLFKNFANNVESFHAFLPTTTFAYPSLLDVNGYPQGTLPTSLLFLIPFPSVITTSTSLTISWSGAAINGVGTAISVQGGFSGFNVTSSTNAGQALGATSTLNLHGTNGVVVFNFTGAFQSNALTVSFQNGATFTSFGQLICCATADYSSVVGASSPADLIAPAYITAMKALAPSAIRMMDYVGINGGNNFTQHRYRAKWQTGLQFTGNGWVPNCWAGGVGTAGPNITRNVSTNVYTAAAAVDTPASYTLGELLQGQFDLASNGTGSVQINVGARGNVPVFDVNGTALNVSLIQANDLTSMIYDDLLGGYIANVPNESEGVGLTQYIPLEILVAICNAVGCDLWYNFPTHITFKSSLLEATDSVTQITNYIKANLNSNLTVHFEYSNEMWNGATFFNQNPWCSASGVALGLPTVNSRNNFGFHGLRHAQIMKQIATAWGSSGAGSRLDRINAAGAYTDQTSTNTYQFAGADLFVGNPAFTDGGTKYASYVNADFHTGSPTFNRPVDVTDTISYATYIQGAQMVGFDVTYATLTNADITTGGQSGWTTGLIGAADAFAAGGATNISNALAFVDWDARQGTASSVAGSDTLLALKSGVFGTGIYPRWEAVAQGYDGVRPPGLPNLFIRNYEGGFQGWYIEALSTAIGLSLNTTSTITFNVGSSPSVSWASNPLQNGAMVGFTSTGVLPTSASISGSQMLAYSTSTEGSQNRFWVVNATGSGFDLAMTPGGAAIVLGGSPTGTATGNGSNYSGVLGRISLLLNAYKNSALFAATITQQFNDFFTTAAVNPSVVNHSKAASWFDFTDGSKWSLYQVPGDIYSNAWQSFSAIAAYNRTP